MLSLNGTTTVIHTYIKSYLTLVKGMYFLFIYVSY